MQSPPYNTVNGVHYGVSHGWGANVLMYNTDVFTTAPTSWASSSTRTRPSPKGKITDYDDPIYIADAALYLKAPSPTSASPIPYELTQPQFDAAVALLKAQQHVHRQVLGHLHRRDRQLRERHVVIGTAWPYQVNALKAENRRSPSRPSCPRRA